MFREVGYRQPIMAFQASLLRLLPLTVALAAPVFAADSAPAPSVPPTALAVADSAPSADLADLKQQLADVQDKLATTLHSYALLEDENARLKQESPTENLQTQVRQLRDQVAELSSENAQLKTRIALLGPLPGSPSRPTSTP
jgi:septal ring factor EnvC (AmiA/AmiB activator)